jgi:hypothetical protein
VILSLVAALSVQGGVVTREIVERSPKFQRYQKQNASNQ